MEIQLVTPPTLPLGFQFGRREMQVLHLWIQMLHLDGGREVEPSGSTQSSYRGLFFSYSYLVSVFYYYHYVIIIITIITITHPHPHPHPD